MSDGIDGRSDEQWMGDALLMLADAERRPNRSVVANEIAAVLTRHYGHLLLSERYGGAHAAIDHVEAKRDRHAARLREQIAKRTTPVPEENRDHH